MDYVIWVIKLFTDHEKEAPKWLTIVFCPLYTLSAFMKKKVCSTCYSHVHIQLCVRAVCSLYSKLASLLWNNVGQTILSPLTKRGHIYFGLTCPSHCLQKYGSNKTEVQDKVMVWSNRMGIAKRNAAACCPPDKEFSAYSIRFFFLLDNFYL